MLRKWMAERSLMLGRLSLGAWLALIVIGSLIPGSLIPEAAGPIGAVLFHRADKVAHGVAYAVLCLLLIWGTAPLRWQTRLIGSAVGATVFGALIEVLQPLTGRSCNLADAGLNALGVLAALLAIALAGRLRRPRTA
jgi:VanZ family protein